LGARMADSCEDWVGSTWWRGRVGSSGVVARRRVESSGVVARRRVESSGVVARRRVELSGVALSESSS
jgi:hypothetical protein